MEKYRVIGERALTEINQRLIMNDANPRTTLPKTYPTVMQPDHFINFRTGTSKKVLDFYLNINLITRSHPLSESLLSLSVIFSVIYFSLISYQSNLLVFQVH